MFCAYCGREACRGECGRELEPPRYCPTCGRTLEVQVSPTGYRAACRRHGAPRPPEEHPGPR
ncbi:MAG TPA: hypothetical protein VM573_00535 [Actinomycetota bacterium]|nr:hypothetical protein [Actinomycetota bacterium]